MNELLDFFYRTCKVIGFPQMKTPGFRYFYRNGWYEHSDAIFLSYMLQFTKPKGIIEIGSGFTTACMLDVRDKFFVKNPFHILSIDPNPRRLFSILFDKDQADTNLNIITSKLQDTPIVYEGLLENDILFIDSSHVSCYGSDVNMIFFDILPRLKKGVLIHFHDIHRNFEYPEKFKNEGWNEAYLLRAFLENNSEYEIVFWNQVMTHDYREWFQDNLPVCLENEGASIWLRKI